jgi:16S rRNA C1402 N4-methylase RsmH
MPTLRAKKFILLRDFRGGAHGRVWLACSASGRVCVLKFSKLADYLGEDSLHKEAKIWNEVWGIPVCLKKLGGKTVLVMPYVKPCTEEFGMNKGKESVLRALEKMAQMCLIHNDLK